MPASSDRIGVMEDRPIHNQEITIDAMTEETIEEMIDLTETTEGIDLARRGRRSIDQ